MLPRLKLAKEQMRTSSSNHLAHPSILRPRHWFLTNLEHAPIDERKPPCYDVFGYSPPIRVIELGKTNTTMTGRTGLFF
jgi:hypothetical protein